MTLMAILTTVWWIALKRYWRPEYFLLVQIASFATHKNSQNETTPMAPLHRKSLKFPPCPASWTPPWPPPVLQLSAYQPLQESKGKHFAGSLELVTFFLGQSFLFFFQQRPFTTWYECYCTNLYLNIWLSENDSEYLQGIWLISKPVDSAASMASCTCFKNVVLRLLGYVRKKCCYV